jgi:glycerophosphoryl diester phosphodiesterase
MSPSPYPRAEGRPLVLGHRGASGEAPENTMAAFRRALEAGADGVELDVWRCGSGEAVVIHDEDARRTGGTPLRVTGASLSRLRELDVGAWRGATFRGERIPRLEEVLEAFPGAVVNVELKAGRVPDPRLAARVACIVRDLRATERVVVSSFHCSLVAAFRALSPRAPSAYLVAPGRLWEARARLCPRVAGANGIHPEHGLVNGTRLREWRARGLAVGTWTVDAPGEVDRLARLGVDAIISNHPGPAREVVRRVTGR